MTRMHATVCQVGLFFTGDFEEIYGVETHPDEPQSGQWDAIMTCFFIDTVRSVLFFHGLIFMFNFQAKNIVSYLRIIHRILAPGGVWINLGTPSLLGRGKISHFTLGPLLWHWENNTTNDPSVELDLEEVKNLARTVGFELSVSFFPSLRSAFTSLLSLHCCRNERTIDTTYTGNAHSMLGYVYHAAFWTATKVA